MSFHTYLDEKKELQDCLLQFIDHKGIDEGIYQNLINLINKQQIREIRRALSNFLHLLNAISINHHRTPDLFTKVEKIIIDLKKEIQDHYTNSEIFHIFRQNKIILLFLIRNKLFTIDESIADILLRPKYYNLNYPHYFFTEIQQFITDPKIKQAIETEVDKNSAYYEKFRKIGENHTDICKIIRDDNLDEFKSYIDSNKTTPTVEPSIFETNPLLLKTKPTLLDYSAFFGSIEIFNFLKESGHISGETWLYAIHGNNFEIIETIISKKIWPKDRTYSTLLRESFRCHHHEISTYTKANLLKADKNRENRYLAECIKFYDYYNFPLDLNNQIIFYNLCYADNASFVSGLLSLLKKEFKVNEAVYNLVL